MSTARKFEKMILLMLLFPEPLLPISKTFLFFAFLSCSDGGDSDAAAATAGAGESISKGKMSSSEEATDGAGGEGEGEGGEGGGDEGEGEGEVCRRLVRGLMPSTKVGNSHSRPLEDIVAVLVRARG